MMIQGGMAFYKPSFEVTPLKGAWWLLVSSAWLDRKQLNYATIYVCQTQKHVCMKGDSFLAIVSMSPSCTDRLLLRATHRARDNVSLQFIFVLIRSCRFFLCVIENCYCLTIKPRSVSSSALVHISGIHFQRQTPVQMSLS